MTTLFTFDLNTVFFHLFTGFLLYLNILILGITCLRIFKEDLNPVLIYPAGLFIFCLLISIFWSLDLNLFFFLFIFIFLLLINSNYLLKYYNNDFNAILLFILVCFLVIVNSTTLHDPDSQNNVHAFTDTYFYIAGIHSDLNFYKYKDLTIYGFEHNLKQQAGVLLAYPFRNFEFFRPILHFSISVWILSLMFVADILRKNIKIHFISYQTLILAFLVYFSFRMNFYLDESLPTILTVPLIFLLSFFFFENFKKEKIVFEIFLTIITLILCFLTKQVLLLIALPIIFLRGLMSKEKKVIYIYFILFFAAIGTILFIHNEHFAGSLMQIRLSKPSIFYGPNSLGLHVLNRSVQLLSLILILLLVYKNFKLLIFTIFSVTIYFCTYAGGPFFFWLLLFIIYSIQKYQKIDFLNLKINNYSLISILFCIFILTYYYFQNYHIKLGTYFLFFLFLFVSLNISKFSSTLKILILVLAFSYPLSFSKKIPSMINYLMETPLDGRTTYLSLSKNIEKIVPENSIIFTDIGASSYYDGFQDRKPIEAYSEETSVSYLIQSKRQFYLLTSAFLYKEPSTIPAFLKLEKNNYKIIYDQENPKNIINEEYYENFYLLINKKNIDKILRNKKNLKIIDKNFALIEVLDKN